MSTRVVDQVDSWDEQSFSGGYRALHELADREFSGVVRAGGAELYMTRGVPVGVRMGEMADFESSGTRYEAPADALPLLAIMQERNDEVKAKYYTEKTSISKVDQTLSDGGFTGFVELSENVLSGDYYLVYQAGNSMSVGYVGEAGRLISGDEAFETTDGEVGIYEVRPAEIEPLEIPEPEEPPEEHEPAGATGESPATSDGAAPADAADDTAASTAEDGADTAAPAEGVEEAAAERTATEGDGADDSDRATPESGRDDPEGSQQAGGEDTGSRAATEDGVSAETSTAASSRTDSTDAAEPQGTAREGGGRPAESRSAPSETTPQERRKDRQGGANRQEKGTRADGTRQGASGARREPSPGRDGQQSSRRARESRPAAGSQDLETKSIPSLNPDRTEIPDRTGTASAGAAVASAPEREDRSRESVPSERQPAEPPAEPTQIGRAHV